MATRQNSESPKRRRLPLRILLVDDSLEFLKSATTFLSLENDFEVVGWALSGFEALDQIDRLRPNIVLMDVMMPGMSGIETSRLIKMNPQAPVVIILTLVNNSEYDNAARAALADGCLAKSDIGTHLQFLIDDILKRIDDTT